MSAISRAALAATLALALALTGQPSTESVAKEKLTVSQGYSRCTTWCNDHNRLGSKKHRACYDQCWRYWSKNGSDARSRQ